MDIRTAIHKVVSSPVSVRLKKRRRRRISDSSSDQYGTIATPLPHPKHKGRRNSNSSSNDVMSINIPEQLDPYSGRFDINSILHGTTPYRSDYKDTDPMGAYWKGIANGASSIDSSIVASSKSSAKALPKRKQSHWPKYERDSYSSESESSYSYSEYETYSCHSEDCNARRVNRPGGRTASPRIEPCPRSANTMKRKQLPPIEGRGYKTKDKLSKPYAHKIGYVPIDNPAVDSEIERQLKQHPAMKNAPFKDVSEYSYSYSSCSRSSCTVRQVKPKKLKPSSSVSSVSSSSTSKPVVAKAAGKTSIQTSSTSSSSSSSKRSVKRSQSTNSHSSRTARQLHHLDSGNNKAGLATRATGSNVLSVTQRYEQNILK